MSRAQRLRTPRYALARLFQLLRGYRRPVSGAGLAEALGISLRTLYRDISPLPGTAARTASSQPGQLNSSTLPVASR